MTDASRKIVIKSPNENLESMPEETSADASPGAPSLLAAEIRNIETLLKRKLVELYAKQKAMQEAGSLSEEAKLNIMAEKLAYESILVCRLQEIAAGYNDTDIADAERLMLELDKKLRGEPTVTKSPLEYFAKSLSQYLGQVGRSAEPYVVSPRRSPVKRKESTAVKLLQKKSNALAKKVDKFIGERIEELSTLIAQDAGRGAQPVVDDQYVGSIVEMVRETVNNKLIQVEVGQIMLHCVDRYVLRI